MYVKQEVSWPIFQNIFIIHSSSDINSVHREQKYQEKYLILTDHPPKLLKMTKSAKKKQKRIDKKKGILDGNSSHQQTGMVTKKSLNKAKLDKQNLKEELKMRKLQGYVPMTKGNSIQDLVASAQEKQDIFLGKEESEEGGDNEVLWLIFQF